MAASSRFRGVRHLTAYDEQVGPGFGAAEAGIMRRPEFARGIRELRERGLIFEAWTFQSQYREVVELARSEPAMTIVLDHFGGPAGVGGYATDKRRSMAEWKTGLREVARCENVYLKLGGLNQGFTGLVDVDQSRPLTSLEMAKQQEEYFREAINIFGTKRCIMESNFPADMIFTSYTIIWNAFKIMTSDLSDEERLDLFMHNAMRVYNIDAPIGN
ncbi:amidohydrolase family protein [Sphingobium cloacae]|nr:amidohydrolase family protein [Sphingobium cloacae]